MSASKPPGPSTDRDEWLLAADRRLLAQCTVDAYRASGPGGQKRNKTSSAIRLRHHPSDLAVIAEESRSQHENKARALRRLRMAIALSRRGPIPADWRPPDAWAASRSADGRIAISRRNRDYPVVVAIVLDVLAHGRGRLRDSAALLGISTGQLSRFLVNDGKVLSAANRIRSDQGLATLRAD